MNRKRRLMTGVVLTGILLQSFSSMALAATTLKDQTAAEEASGISAFFSAILSKAPGWIAAIVVFAFSFVAAKIVKEKVVDEFSKKFASEDQDALILIGRFSYAAALSIGIMIALKFAGIDVTSIFAAFGFALGFAMKDLMMNFISGILILVNRQFSIGDFIQVNDTMGKVVEIQSRATILKAIDGTRVIVPNADLFQNKVTNFTANPFRRIEIMVGVDYRTDVDYATKVLKDIVHQFPGVVLEPAPVVLLSEFGDSSVDFVVRFWVDSHSNWLKTKSQVMKKIKETLDEKGIEVPFNTMNIVMDRDNEKIVMPRYAVPEQEMMSRRQAQEVEEAALAQQIEDSKKVVEIPVEVQPAFTPPPLYGSPAMVADPADPQGVSSEPAQTAAAPAASTTPDAEMAAVAAIQALPVMAVTNLMPETPVAPAGVEQSSNEQVDALTSTQGEALPIVNASEIPSPSAPMAIPTEEQPPIAAAPSSPNTAAPQAMESPAASPTQNSFESPASHALYADDGGSFLNVQAVETVVM
ncbi:MAG: hypothetical protein UW70_C0054G0009, partial [Candidatus Peregrinibacteria bacterium GW2011_GWA2_44_7]